MAPNKDQRDFLPWRGLIWQLFVITILPLTVLTIVIAFGSLSVHQKAMRMMVGERDLRTVQTAAAALNEQFRHRLEAIQSLSIMAENTFQTEPPEILHQVDILSEEFELGLAVFNQDGTLAEAGGDEEFWKTLEANPSPAFNRLFAPDNPAGSIASEYRHPVSGERILLFAAVSPDQDWVTVGASTVAQIVEHTLSSSFAGESNASVILVDGSSTILYGTGALSTSADPGAHPGIAEALGGKSGVTYVQAGDIEHVLTYSPIPLFGWALALEEPWETVDTPTLRTTQLGPLVLVPVLLLTLLAIWFGLRWIVKPLQDLEARAATLAWGDFEAIEQPVGGITEIRRLQAELVHMAQKVRAAQQSMHSYIGAITAGQEEERLRLARELHDDTIQSLIALKQRVQLTQMATQNGSSNESLAEVVSLTEQAIENVRRQTRALRPIYLEDLGLVTALEMLARESSQSASIPISFQRFGTELRLKPEVELALYRMAQEALNNVSRHASATRAELTISFSASEITMQVSDNGIGFEVPKSPAEFAPGGHFGLLGMYERAELIGARLEIVSGPNQGSKIAVHLAL